MEASTFRKVYPTEFYQKFLRMDVRPDGRMVNRVRETTITTGSIGTAYGSSFVKIGNTSVVAAVKGEVGPPPIEEQNKQHIIINLELKPICSDRFPAGKPPNLAQCVGVRLNRICKEKGFVDATTLCIEKDRMMWYLYVDIYCLNYDGNVFDASLLALVAALRNARLPTSTYEEDETGDVKVTISRERKVRLSLGYTPVPLTFGVFEEGFIIADPTAEEETLLVSEYCIVMNDKKKVCSMYKQGGKAISAKIMKESMIVALERVDEIMALFENLQSEQSK